MVEYWWLFVKGIIMLNISLYWLTYQWNQGDMKTVGDFMVIYIVDLIKQNEFNMI